MVKLCLKTDLILQSEGVKDQNRGFKGSETKAVGRQVFLGTGSFPFWSRATLQLGAYCLYAPSACFSPCPGWPEAMLGAGFIQNLASHLTEAVTGNSSLSAGPVQCLTCSGVFPSVSGRRFPGEFGRRCQFLAPAWLASQALLASCILNMVSHP